MNQILTEEELNRYEREFKNSVRAKAMYESDHILIEEIIESHRELFKANAELSFKNQKYKEALETISEGVPPYAPITIISMKEHYESTATKALEVWE